MPGAKRSAESLVLSMPVATRMPCRLYTSNGQSSAVVSTVTSLMAVEFLTSTFRAAVMPSQNATSVASPSATPVTMPSVVTVAMSSSRLYHLTGAVVASAGVTDADVYRHILVSDGHLVRQLLEVPEAAIFIDLFVGI